MHANLQLSDRDGAFSYSVSATAVQDRFQFDSSGVETGVSPSGETTTLRTVGLPQDGQVSFLNLSPRLNWTLGQDNTLTWQSFVNHNRFKNRVDTDTTTLIGSAPPFPDLTGAYRTTGNSLRSDLTWSRKFTSGAKLDLKVGVNAGESESNSNRSAFAASGAPLLDTHIDLANRDQGLARTYKAPSVQNLRPRRQVSGNNSSTEPDSQGNRFLKPELAFGIDAAYEHYWAEGAMVSIGGSMRRISDFTRTLVYFDGARWIATPSNQDSAVTRSLELETKFPLKALMTDAPAIDLRASLTGNWSRVESAPGPDNRLDQLRLPQRRAVPRIDQPARLCLRAPRPRALRAVEIRPEAPVARGLEQRAGPGLRERKHLRGRAHRHADAQLQLPERRARARHV